MHATQKNSYSASILHLDFTRAMTSYQGTRKYRLLSVVHYFVRKKTLVRVNSTFVASNAKLCLFMMLAYLSFPISCIAIFCARKRKMIVKQRADIHIEQ